MTSRRTPSSDVTVIGCGLMGSALVRQFAKSGYKVAAWNRTHERAEALAGDGVTPIRSVVDAVRSSPLVVTCTIDYDSTLSALDPVDSWDGTALVNLAIGSPDQAEEFERWATERGADYLDGNVLGYPQDVGSAALMLVYSGPRGIWAMHEETLVALGVKSRHIAEDIRTANVLTVAFAAFYLPVFGAFVEAASYVLGEGVPARLFLDITGPMLGQLPAVIEDDAAAITSGHHETDQAAIETHLEGLRSFLDVMRGAGHQARIVAATVENLEAADAAGLGKLGFAAQTKVARRDPA